MKYSKSIYQYKDYRKYLRDYYDGQKQCTSRFTYEYFSKQAKIKSPNFLKLVMNGKRNLTIEKMHQFAKALKLSQLERNYFEILVFYNQAESEQTQTYYYQKLKELSKLNPAKKVECYTSDIIAQWYYPALILYLHDKEATVDLAPLALMVGVGGSDIGAIIKELLSAKILIIENNKYYSSSAYFYIHRERTNIIQQSYLRSQLCQSLKAFDNQQSGKKQACANFFSHTFTLSKAEWEKYVELVKSFLETTTTLSNEDTPNAIAQLNIQLFTVE